MNVQTNYCDNNLLILDVQQLNKIMELYYFYTFKALWDGQAKIWMYYWMSRVKKQLSAKKSSFFSISGINLESSVLMQASRARFILSKAMKIYLR